MTELAAVALNFARECLDWPEVETFVVGYRKQIVRNMAAPGECWTVFNAADLNTVAYHVREWCDRRGQNLKLNYDPPPASLWHASAGGDPFEHTDLCIALMAACVEASRKLKNVTGEPPTA